MQCLSWLILALRQAAKTYLERTFETFPGCSLDQLIQHALKALSASVTDGELKVS